ncbi:hypothetical protein MRB53_000187 [Persea americana]|uniref:Uncharacterized protein n=1 Tax=Persea americana TaxID=3435 RepID=A0ACC2MNE2_PERAE|nr:hypothetical protein MRB53_000187 [Persea americana]
MAKRSIEFTRESEEEEDEDDVIEEIFVEEDEDEDELEEEAEEKKKEEEEGVVEERKKRVRAGIDGERRGSAVAVNSISTTQRCQADNCEADLGVAKKYHQRHKVCENHSKAKVVLVGGIQQRYCQQCSRFHELSQFDDAKRSCRERLAHHNERRRKIPPDQQTEDPSQIPVVLQVKDRSPRQTRSLKTQRHSEVIKIAIPRNPTFKHFQIR